MFKWRKKPFSEYQKGNRRVSVEMHPDGSGTILGSVSAPDFLECSAWIVAVLVAQMRSFVSAGGADTRGFADLNPEYYLGLLTDEARKKIPYCGLKE